MLSRLHIRNLAVLDDVALDLGAGFSALTGETGAGKSMLVDALALALGSRADSAAVRAGAERAEITATFELGDAPGATAWLRAHDLDSDEECVVRRVVGAEGRSRGYVNGRPVPVELLRELGAQLVEICGQHAYQSLGQRAAQRDLLDAYGGHAGLCAAMSRAHADWSALRIEQAALLEARRDRRAREELLRYQVTELAALNLQGGEFEALEREQRLLAHAGRLAEGLALALTRLYDADEDSAHGTVAAALREVRALAAFDPALGAAAEALARAEVDLREAAEHLRRRQDALEHDPGRQAEVETRLAAVLELARKHHVAPEQLAGLLAQLQSDLDGIGADEERLQHLDAELAAREREMRAAAAALTEARAAAGEALSRAVTAQLQRLGMAGSSLVVSLQPLRDGQVTASGQEQVELLVSTNPGQPPAPVARVASGGELSRLSLAIQVVCVADRGAPTLIFDEVDAGIGGGVAEIVGQCLRALSARRQVLCVTHLAQVASQADHHFAVAKATVGDAARTGVTALEGRLRVEEIARMLGGVRITERTRAHAREMLQASGSRRAG